MELLPWPMCPAARGHRAAFFFWKAAALRLSLFQAGAGPSAIRIKAERGHAIHPGHVGEIDLLPLVVDAVVVGEHVGDADRVRGDARRRERGVVAGAEVAIALGGVLHDVDAHRLAARWSRAPTSE